MSKDEVSNIRVVEIKDLYIGLNQTLKFANMVQSGGEAKHVIGEGLVYVNGEVETRIRKKIFHGDIVTFANEKVQIVAKEGAGDSGQE